MFRISSYNRLYLTYKYPQYIHYNERNEFEPIRTSSIHYNATDYVTIQRLFHHKKPNVRFYYEHIHNFFDIENITRFKRIMLLYFRVQRFKMAFSKFIHIVKLKVSKQFNTHNLSYLPFSNRTISIYENNRVYLFDDLELYKMIETCFNYELYDIPDILTLKNPYTNIPFSFHNLLHIHFELLRFGKVSKFFILYFKHNFNKNTLLEQYQTHLYINCLERTFSQFTPRKKELLLMHMLRIFPRYKTFLNIDTEYLHQLFDSVVKYFYIYRNLKRNDIDNDSTHIDLYESKFKKRLEHVYKKNPMLGRKVFVQTIDGNFKSHINQNIAGL